jgi:sarcosine oxidase subunit gamma
MHERVVSESPLVRFAAHTRATVIGDAAAIFSERPSLGHVNLRGDSRDDRFIVAVEATIGIGVPPAPNSFAEGAGNTVYWLGPNEWLIVTSRGREATIARELREALAGLFVAVTEVSGGQTVIVLRGRAVRDVLAKGCPLDLHPRAFGPGRCAQSHLAKAPILVRQVDAEPTFEIIVRRSFADYLWLWLDDANSTTGAPFRRHTGETR